MGADSSKSDTGKQPDKGQLDAGVSKKDGSVQKDNSALAEATPTPRKYYYYGGGLCAMSEDASALDSLLLLLPLVVVFAMRRRRRWLQRRRRGAPLAVLILLASLGLSAQVEAQAGGYNADQFRPSPTVARGFFQTESAQMLPRPTFNAGLYLGYANTLVQIWDDTNSQTTRNLLEHQLKMDLLGSVSLWGRLELGFGLPIALWQEGEDFSSIGGSGEVGTAVGDLRLVPKGRIATLGPVHLGLAVPISLPTGDDDSFKRGVDASRLLSKGFGETRPHSPARAGCPTLSVVLRATGAWGTATGREHRGKRDSASAGEPRSIHSRYLLIKQVSINEPLGGRKDEQSFTHHLHPGARPGPRYRLR